LDRRTCWRRGCPLSARASHWEIRTLRLSAWRPPGNSQQFKTRV